MEFTPPYENQYFIFLDAGVLELAQETDKEVKWTHQQLQEKAAWSFIERISASLS